MNFRVKLKKIINLLQKYICNLAGFNVKIPKPCDGNKSICLF